MTAGNGRAGTGSGAALGDTVAKVVRQWQTVHPGIDTAPPLRTDTSSGDSPPPSFLPVSASSRRTFSST